MVKKELTQDELLEFLYSVDKLPLDKLLEFHINHPEYNQFIPSQVTYDKFVDYSEKVSGRISYQHYNKDRELKYCFILMNRFSNHELLSFYSNFVSQFKQITIPLRKRYSNYVWDYFKRCFMDFVYIRNFNFKDMITYNLLGFFADLNYDSKLYFQVDSSDYDYYLSILQKDTQIDKKYHESLVGSRIPNKQFNLVKRDLPDHFFKTLDYLIQNSSEKTISFFSNPDLYVNKFINTPRDVSHITQYMDIINKYDIKLSYTPMEISHYQKYVEPKGMTDFLQSHPEVETFFTTQTTFGTSNKFTVTTNRAINHTILNSDISLELFNDYDSIDLFGLFINRYIVPDFQKAIVKLKNKFVPTNGFSKVENELISGNIMVGANRDDYRKVARDLIDKGVKLNKKTLIYTHMSIGAILRLDKSQYSYDELESILMENLIGYGGASVIKYLNQLPTYGFPLEHQKRLFKKFYTLQNMCLITNVNTSKNRYITVYLYHKDYYNLPKEFLVGEMGFLEVVGELPN